MTKSVCAAIVRYLLPEYIRIPTGNSLKEIVLSFKNDISVLEQLMERIFPSFHQKCVQLTIIVARAGIPLFYKEQ